MFQQFPYTNFHDMNLDWILKTLKSIDITQEDIERVEQIYAELGPYVFKTVKTYGAVGDGVTDDSAAIQECIDNESLIIFPPGQYLIQNDLTTSDANKMLIGYPYAQILEDNASIGFTNTDNIILSGLEFNCVNTKPNSNVTFWRSKNILVENCIFLTAKQFNVQCSTCGKVTIRNCKMSETEEHTAISISIDVGYESTEYGRGGWTNIESCDIRNAGLDGIIANNYNVTISNCTIHGCGTYSSAAGIYQNDKENLKISNCDIKGCTGNGLDIIYSENVNISNCIIDSCNSAGIFLCNVKDGNITDCFTMKNGSDPIDSTQNSGIVLAKSGVDPCENIYLSHCFSKDNYHYGYRFVDCTDCYTEICYSDNNVDGDSDQSGTIYRADYTAVTI